MKACPWCGRNNLDSDEYCFNCERDLDAVPGEEEAFEYEEEIRRIRVHRPPSMLRLVLASLVRKALFVLLALGAFFIFALIAIWVSYDNSTVALVALGFLGLAVLFALCYPDAKTSRKVGMRGMWVSLISNLIILGVCTPPALWFLSSRGYISGAWDFLASYWWGFLAVIVLAMFVSWMAARRTYAETANP
ncbi:MAG: hypothetical protein AB1384_02990 [Actinomycetota bacterium]